VLLGSNPSTATPESGDVLLTTITLQAEGGDSCELGLTITTLKDNDSAVITLDSVINGTFTVDTIGPPTLTWQVEPPASVTQGDDVTFRVGFSESADYYFRIENNTDDVVWRYPTSGTNAAKNPTNKTWKTTTDTPLGDYTIIININGVDNADNRTVTVEPAGSVETYVSIEDANSSVGATTTAQIVAYGVTNLSQFGIVLSYDPSVVMALSAENNPNLPDDFSGSSLHDFSHASEGYVLLGSNPSTATPESGDVLLTTVTLQAEGGDSCELGLTITTLKDNDSAVITLDSVINGTFTVTGASDMTTYYRDADGDGYGNASDSIEADSAPAGYVTDNTDCDDTNAAVNPGATEVRNGIDDDCDGQIDEGCPTIRSATLSPNVIQSDGTDSTTLRVTVLASGDDDGIASVTVNLSAIGGPDEQTLTQQGDIVANVGTWTTTISTTHAGTFGLPVTATDDDGSSATTDVTLTAGPNTYTLSLMQGWNMISLPCNVTAVGIDTTQKLGDLITDAGEDCYYVAWFNATSQTMVSDIISPPEGMPQDTTYPILVGQGYFVFVADNLDVVVAGTQW
jgi:hypothetical protein